VEAFRPILYAFPMTTTIEQRVAELEKKVAELSGRQSLPGQKDPWRTFGSFANDPDFEQASRLGREYRAQQTHAQEIAAP